MGGETVLTSSLVSRLLFHDQYPYDEYYHNTGLIVVAFVVRLSSREKEGYGKCHLMPGNKLHWKLLSLYRVTRVK